VSAAEAATRPAPQDRAFPPVAQCVVVSLALVIIGGIWMASYFPRRPPLAPPTVLWVLSAAVLVTGFVLLARVADFAWAVFGLVWRWALLAYVVIASLIEFAFVHNGATGAPLALVTAMLVIFALDVATVIAVTVARYQTPPS
jgi:hypothetical protein